MMFVVWLISLPLRDVSIIDLMWGSGFVVVTWCSLFLTQAFHLWAWILVGCVTLWGVRLSGYLVWRNLGKPEDFRYRQMRKKNGRWFPLLSLLIVFWLQGAIMWIVSLPVQTAMLVSESDGMNLIAGVGVLIWLIGLMFESIGDFQLAKFKSNPVNEGKVLDSGLWRYTRHPNYFGDFLIWWGLYFIAFGDGCYWWTIIGPVMMSIFLMHVSGVTLLEKSLKDRKPEYANYIARTSAFFPAPPRRSR